MKIKTFETEEYFGKYEFTKPYLLSASDCETVSIAELIQFGGGSLEEFSKIKLGYPEMPGSQTLRKEISTLYGTIDPEQVLVLGSPIEGIYLTMRALLNKGDHVVVLSPAYDALFNIADHVSGNLTRWFLKNGGVKWSLDLKELEKIISERTKLIIINFPHNPTGFLPSENELKKIIEIASRRGVRIFSDEMYRGLEYDSNDRLSSLADLYDKAITLNGASKSLGLPGLRFGWLTTKEPSLYKELMNLKSYTSMCSTQAGEYLGLMALRGSIKLVEKNLKIIKKNLSLAEEFFPRWQAHVKWIKPLAGSVSTIKLNEPSAEKFCHKLASKFGVVLLPIKFMGYDDQYARIGFGRLNFESCLQVFEKALDSIYQ